MSKSYFFHPFELLEIFKRILYNTGMKRGSSKVLNAIHMTTVTLVDLYLVDFDRMQNILISVLALNN